MKTVKLIQLVALDDRGFIRTYCDIDPKWEKNSHGFQINMGEFIHSCIEDPKVAKIEIKKWQE